MTRVPRRLSLLLACTFTVLCASAPVQAVPTTDGDAADREAAAARDAVLPDLPVDTDGPDTARTIRMLLELQGAPPPIEGATDPRRKDSTPGPTRPRLPGIELSTAGSAPAAPAAPAPVATPGVAGEAAGKVDWRVGLPGGIGFGVGSVGVPTQAREGQAANRTPRPGADEEVDAIKALLPAKLFELLREYREWLLLGGTIALMLLGLSASLVSQRHR